MATQDSSNDFWSSFSQWGPGLVSTAGGWYQNKQAEDEAKKRAAAINQDPNMQGLTEAQMMELRQSGSMDPAKLFEQQQGLMAPVKEKGQADLMRDLYRKGMLGLATDQQAGGGQTWQNQPGVRSNPLAAAYFAAQAGADQKAAFDSIKQASDLRTAGVSRAATLGGARQQAQNTAAAAQPARTQSGFSGMLSGITGLLGNKGVMDSLGKFFKSDPNASAKVGAGQMPGQAPRAPGGAPVAAPGGYDRTVDDFGGGYNMPTPQIGMDDMYGGGIFATPTFDYASLFGGNDYGWNSGWDVGGGLTWSGEYE